MPLFEVHYWHGASDGDAHAPAQGLTCSRQVQAPDRQGVAAALGIDPRHILAVRELTQALRKGASAQSSGQVFLPEPFMGRPRFPLRLFSQELAVLLDAGIPLLEALHTLHEKEPHDGVRAVLQLVAERLRQGLALSEALREQPAAFDDLVCAIVAANERSGQLSTALSQHAIYLAWVEGLRARLLAACVYPALLLAVGGLVILFLLLYVLPRFAGILDGTGAELPWASRQLVVLGQVAAERPWAVWLAACSVVGAGVALARSAAWRDALRRWAWQMPGLGPRLRVLALARLYRCLGMLLGAGIPALTALRIARGVVAAPWRAALGAAAQAVERGERLSDALEAQQLATPVAKRMLRVGERSGELPRMLERAAAFHDEEVVRLTEWLTKAITPLLMLLMGLVVGGIVVLMYLPIFQLVEQVQ